MRGRWNLTRTTVGANTAKAITLSNRTVTMATKTVYITVRLDLECPAVESISDEEAAYFIDEMDYSFTAPEGSGITITDTEICGRNDESGIYDMERGR